MKQKNNPKPRQTDTGNAASPIPRKEQLKQRLLDHYDLQEMFNVTRGTIYNWCCKGFIKIIKIGGKNYFDANDVDAMLQERKQFMIPGEVKQRKK